jgi:tetratricopeptide (TPR) repeat protein
MRWAVLVVAALLPSLPALAGDPRALKICLNSKDPEAVIAACTKVIGDDTWDAGTRGSALYFRARAREGKNDIEGAMADLNEAIKVDPKPASAYLDRALLYRQAGDDEKAFADFNAAIRNHPHVALFYYARGQFYSDKGRYDSPSTTSPRRSSSSPTTPKPIGGAAALIRNRMRWSAPSPTSAR